LSEDYGLVDKEGNKPETDIADDETDEDEDSDPTNKVI